MSKKGRRLNRLRYEEKKLGLRHHFENGVSVEDLAEEMNVHTSTGLFLVKTDRLRF